MDKRAETCEQESRLVDIFVNNTLEACGQESRDLWTSEQRLVDKRAEVCGQKSQDLWSREWKLLGIFPAMYTHPVQSTYINKYTDNSAVLITPRYPCS